MPATQRAGDVRTQHGDLCASRAAVLNEEKDGHEKIRADAIRELNEGHYFEYVAVPGRAAYPIPKDVLSHLKKKFGR